MYNCGIFQNRIQKYIRMSTKNYSQCSIKYAAFYTYYRPHLPDYYHCHRVNYYVDMKDGKKRVMEKIMRSPTDNIYSVLFYTMAFHEFLNKRIAE